ncbi:unnamed protein product [Rotaria sp. Silwood2]|nr:unnamed protein product [Rotaria sp. Silwood2]CAF4380385.1 unnamed protein product [Rotaria sp. Silwood2]
MSFLYNTNHNSKTNFDCFYASIIDDLNQTDRTFLRTNYLTPYCLRPLSNDSIGENLTLIQGYVENVVMFKTLRSQGINSEHLLQWSISIDIIEQYAIYLITNDTKFDDISFYNCSTSWFGSHCQYTFGSNIFIESFGDFIVSLFNNRKQYHKKLIINTCYPHLSGCYRGPEPMCLDWREICNGIIDCIGESFGMDEQYCDEIEMNECKEDEYRCHNGAQCIPLVFFRDGWTSKDCLDGTDEDEISMNSQVIDDVSKLDCIGIVTFPCEERSCRIIRSFPCGDGECRRSGFIDNYIYPYEHLCTGTNRDFYYAQAVYKTNNHLSSDCRKLLFCTLRFHISLIDDKYDGKYCSSENWLSSNNCSMDHVSFPTDPMLNRYFQVIYSSESLVNSSFDAALPNYICNDPRQCLHLPKTTLQIGRLDCHPFEPVIEEFRMSNLFYLHSALNSLDSVCALMGNINKYTSNSSLFYCELSHRYVSKYRLFDGITDCYHSEDETYPDNCLLNNSQRFPCESKKKCLSSDCISNQDSLVDEFLSSTFALLCDDIFDGIYDDDENDESNCEWWPCYNPYTRCDTIFQCANGIDEMGCPNTNCSINELKCNINDPPNSRCIHQAHIYEKPINCSRDNSDEIICRKLFYSTNLTNEENEYLSWKENTCLRDNDICDQQSINTQHSVCNYVKVSGRFTCDKLILNIHNNEPLCVLKNGFILPRLIRFLSIFNIGYLPPTINITSAPSPRQHIHVKKNKILALNTSIDLIEYCNRGIVIFEGKSYKKKCLCSPSYFGDQCQWQSQRVSLTLRIRYMGSVEKKNFLYDIFIYLIDDEYQIIHYYEEINYNPSIDCETKFNRYLLYPTRPKNLNHTYSIRIDIFDKITLNYYGSWHLFIPFPFLPVNRLSTQLNIPFETSESSKNCLSICGIHGKCFNYINSSKSFCKCDERYYGRFCNLTYQCLCSSDSICLNSSICLCPLNKFGSKCYLQHTSCQSHNNLCKNDGKCVPINDRISNIDFTCLCTEDYMGSYCEYKSYRIDIHFKTDIIPSIIFAHFIIAFDDKKHERITKFKKVPFDQHSVTLFTRHSFHILFIEFLNNSYLTVLREKLIPSEYISIDIKLDSMCVNITKLLNSTIFDYNYLHQLKYYQLPCLENKKLKCFYDEKHMCICDKNRFSNCFQFNHNMSYDCQGYNYCQNNGKCFQDNVTCPTTTICMCEKCYYGNKCQFSTKGFSLSLDVIFGYHIKPFISFFKQSKVVKINAALTIVMFIFGFINGLLSILIFQTKSSVVVGCRIYLLTTSIISLLTINIFTIKCWQLIFFQMNIITNRLFLYVNCLFTDVLLKILLSSGDWLNACVAIERAFTAIQGLNFNKSKSKYIAKCVLPIMFLLIIISYIHDPIFRELFDDEDESRIWCIVNYSSKLKIFDIFINIFHFLTPFIINFLSALIIIIQVFKTRRKIQKDLKRKTLIYAEIKRHKHILIAPCVLIILALPRLIISLLSRCMESARDPWLFLAGFYVSFLPSLLIIVVFVLPSEKYKDEFLRILRKKRFPCRQ